MTLTEARRRFRAEVKKRKEHGGQAEVARTLKCSRAFVNLLVKGKRLPGHLVSYRIEEAFGIPHEAWLEGKVA